MKPEEFEVYVIPPNFMEGGTLFGGLLKTRNTVEAVILGLVVGVPVLHLPFSLTVRVVILCLTALPLVLLALIGVILSKATRCKELFHFDIRFVESNRVLFVRRKRRAAHSYNQNACQRKRTHSFNKMLHG